jgi:hypothetical protein
MASDFQKPFSQLSSLLPPNLVNDLNSSLIETLFDPQLTHEEAEHFFGLIGKYFPNEADVRAWLSQANVERQFNQLSPMISLQHGTSEYTFSQVDILNKAEAAGIDVPNLEKWGTAQGFNFAPPINFDKFVNFSQYYWVQAALPQTSTNWNPANAPEYYVIAKPSNSDVKKLPVVAATTQPITLTGTTVAPEIWNVVFQNSVSYKVIGSLTGEIGTGTIVSVSTPSGIVKTSIFTSAYLNFNVTVVGQDFVVGDYFTIKLTQLSSQPAIITFTGLGNGNLTGAKGNLPYGIIDGVQLEPGVRVLVKDQIDATENGIYIVSNSTWERAADSDALLTGLETYVQNGSQKGTWRCNPGYINWTYVNAVTNLSEWQSANYWVHKVDLANYSLSNASIQQAVRPIIEFDNTIELAAGQVKNRFNQLPQFNLYWPNGVKTPWTSGIFYYVEDQSAPFDIKLQRRVKVNENSTFWFEQGLISPNTKRLLTFKNTTTNTLHTCWIPGPNTIKFAGTVFSGTGVGELTNVVVTGAQFSEEIVLTAVDYITFLVEGSRTGQLGFAKAGQSFSSNIVNFDLSGGFAVGDKFMITLVGPEHPRYAIANYDGVPITYPSDPITDASKMGTWLTAPQLVYNPMLENRAQILHGDLTDHFISIIKSQIGFTGSSFGSNDYRTLTADHGYGGSIKVIDSAFNLLVGLLNQENSSPITILDFAEKQYSISINSIADYLTTLLPEALIENSSAVIDKLFDQYVTYYKARTELTNIYRDTSSPIPNWPLTLPLLGLVPGVEPKITYDFDLRANVLIHHDGHESTLFAMTAQQEMQLALTPVKRFDGTTTPGTVGVAPTKPYKGQLWFNTQNLKLYVASIQFEGQSQPLQALDGDYWYDRSTDVLLRWNAGAGIWVSQSTFPWTNISVSTLIDAVTLKAEQILYARWLLINSTGQALKWINAQTSDQLMGYELSKFAVANGYDPLGSNYNPSDSFTWNYASVSPGSIGLSISEPTPARWHKLYERYFLERAGFATSRPDLEPWKLMGFDTKPLTWDAQYASTIQPSQITEADQFLGEVDAVSVVHMNLANPNYNVDTVQLSTGEKLLLICAQNENDENGIYEIVNGVLTKLPIPAIGSYVVVKDGTYKGSLWVYTGTTYVQARLWSTQMWDDIATYRSVNSLQSLRYSVNINLDTLLPPYVSLTKWESQFAIITSIPTGISAPYSYGDEGPVELVWKKSLAYNYAKLRVNLKLDPINFLASAWGFQTVQNSDIRIDKFTGRLLAHSDFSLHSEPRPTRESGLPELEVFGVPVDPVDLNLVAIYQQANGVMLFVDVDKNVFAEEGAIYSIYPDLFIAIPTSSLTTLTQVVSSNGYEYVIGDKIVIKDSKLVEFIPATTTNYVGLNQLYCNFLRYNSLDSSIATDVALLRDWKVQLGYRVGALLETDTLELHSDNFGQLPMPAYEVKVKTSSLVKNLWGQALRIQLLQVGSDFTTIGLDSNGQSIYKPTNGGETWVFRVENYFSRHPSIDRYSLDTQGSFETFNAIDSLHSTDEWRNYLTIIGTETVNLPITIVGIQNVVNFVNGYNLKMTDDGFNFSFGSNSQTDATTNKIMGWQLEVEKFIDSLYKGTLIGTGFMLNPFIYGFELKTSTGILAPFKTRRFDDILTGQFVYDLLGEIIQPKALQVTRKGDSGIVKAIVPIFGAHVQTIEYEHAILFENYAGFNNSNLIYDPFLSVMVEKLLISGKQQLNKTFRPVFGGYFLSGHDVKKNIANSIDQVANYYNTDTVFNDQTTTKHALALFGFSPKTYFNLLDSTPKSEFNFWRGLISAKGTNQSIHAYLNSAKYDSVSIDEFWAYKIAQYGDARPNVYPELRINTKDCVLKHTRLYFQEGTETPAEAFTVINPADESRWFSSNDLATFNPSLLENGATAQLYFDAEETKSTVELTAEKPVRIFADRFELTGPGIVSNLSPFVVKVSASGSYSLTTYTPAKPKFSPIKLIDYVEPALIEDITTWHPAFGAHSALAYEVLNTIGENDPAIYNYSTQTIGNPNYDPNRVWGEQEVGRTWWDTTGLEYIPYYDTNIFPNFEERLARWGSLTEYSKVKVYEWISSTTKPTEYDAQAAIDQLSADIPANQKRTGTAARKQTYSRARTWKARPVAWSYVQNPSASSTPTILKYGTCDLTISAITGVTTVVLGAKTFAEFGLGVGSHISGWADNKPFGELILTGPAAYLLGTSTENGTAIDPIVYFTDVAFTETYIATGGEVEVPALYDSAQPVMVSINSIPLLATDFDSSTGVNIILFTPLTAGDVVVIEGQRNQFIKYTKVKWTKNKSNIGNKLGELKFAFSTFGSKYYLSVTKVATDATEQDYTQRLELNEFGGVEGDLMVLDFDQLGIQLEATYSANVSTSALQLWTELKTIEFDVYVRQYMNGTVKIPFPVNEFSNSYNNLNPTKTSGIYGWRGWTMPTQTQLDADLKSPLNSWRPIYGDWLSVNTTSALVTDITEYAGKKYILNDGTRVEYYSSTWEDWNILVPEKYSTFGQNAQVQFAFTETLDASRLAVYVNGLTQLTSSYVLDAVANTVTISSVAAGHEVMAILSPYEPSTAELAFDPSVSDDFSIQVQYKVDYQYVTKNIRDSSGNITGQQYFFWVENKTVAANGKNLNLQQAQMLLTNGPSTYLTFQQLTPASGELPERYKAVTIAGLNLSVLKDNTYKLRFTRDFILRDDPNDIQLKNVHTEWLLIRPNQSSLIPTKLWNKLVDSACGKDVIGNQLPSLKLKLYDERNGTQVQFGFGANQVLAPRELIIASLTTTIKNPKTYVYVNGINTPAVIQGLDYTNSAAWFSDAATTRQTLELIWKSASPKQVNELFFEVLNDALANNYEFTDIFKTSRISAHSIMTSSTQHTINNANVYY